MSEGDLDKLRYAVGLAKRDWRDVLVAGGFGRIVHAHEEWHPEESS